MTDPYAAFSTPVSSADPYAAFAAPVAKQVAPAKPAAPPPQYRTINTPIGTARVPVKPNTISPDHTFAGDVRHGFFAPLDKTAAQVGEVMGRRWNHLTHGDVGGVLADLARTPADAALLTGNLLGVAGSPVTAPVNATGRFGGRVLAGAGVQQRDQAHVVPGANGQPEFYMESNPSVRKPVKFKTGMFGQKVMDMDQFNVPMTTDANRNAQEKFGEDVSNLALMAVPGAAGKTKLVGEGTSLAEKAANVPLLRPVVRTANKVTGGKLLDPVYQAKQVLSAAIAKDGGTPEQIAAITQQWAKTGASDPSLMDAVAKLPNGGQNTLARIRGAAVSNPTARGALSGYRKKVESGVQDNAQRLTRNLNQDARSTPQFLADTENLQRSNAETMYADDYKQPVDLTPDTMAALRDKPGRQALLRARSAAVANQRNDQVAEIDRLLNAPPMKPSVYAGPPPRVSAGTVDRARIQMREMAGDAAKAGHKDMARGLGGRVRQIDSTLEATPGLQPARADYGNKAAQIDAAEYGRDNIWGETMPEDFTAGLDALNGKVRPVGDVPVDAGLADVRHALQVGARNRLNGVIGAPPEGATGILNKLSTSPNMTQKLGQVFGEDAAANYQAGIGNEVHRAQVARGVDPLFGSKTAVNAEDSNALGLIEGALDFKKNAFKAALQKLQQGLTLTDAEAKALVELGTGRADLGGLAPIQSTVTTASGPPLLRQAAGASSAGNLAVPPLDLPLRATAQPPQKRPKRK